MNRDLLLIDGHGLAFRGFYALPDTLMASDGTPTNAILGFTNMLFKAMEEWKTERTGLFFDPHGPTRRNEMYEKYKTNRKPAPESFKVQMPLIIEMSRAMGIPVFMRDGIEADDYIVSTARASAAEGWNVLILSADKDLFQIINEQIKVIRPRRGVNEFDLYDRDFFIKKYGFEPERMTDYLALTGDTADNIPGVAGIGEKSASEMLAKYSCIDDIYAHLDDFKGAKKTRLENGREAAIASRELVVPLDTAPALLDDMKQGSPDMEKLGGMCERLGMRKLLSRFGGGEVSLPHSEKPVTPTPAAVDAGPEITGLDELKYVPLAEVLASGDAAVAECGDGRFVACDRDGNAAAFGEDDTRSDAWREWTEHGRAVLYGYRRFLSSCDAALPAFDRVCDVEAAHYMLHPDRAGDAIAKTLGHAMPFGEELAKRLFELYDTFDGEVRAEGLETFMYELDMPLSPVLANLKKNGIYADPEKLSSLRDELTATISKIEREFADLSGESINLNSPKQVGSLLFETLKLPALKKTKTGYSTSAEVLEELAALPEPLCLVPAKLIEYREASKMLSGFTEPFLELSRTGGGRIHSTFDQFATGTGRLASYDPNVQNIPQFGSLAEKFRSCFVPSSPDRIFVAADYSQIELRVLAHMSGEERLIDAFTQGRDIHMETASWVFGLPPEDITKEQRRFAKTVNFGLLYGMSAFGLAQRLGVSRQQATSIVDRYFSVLPKIKGYMETSIAKAKAAGRTVSLFGRIRPLSEVSTIEGRGNHPLDRIAVNTPIQSTASDIAKIALMRFDSALAKKFPSAKTVLQVHDSIICECEKSDADGVEHLLLETMENACKLNVPLDAKPKRGASLNEV